MQYGELLELVKSRRSTRRFKPDPIPEDSVLKIIEVARWAPSGFNLQPWEFVIVRNPELKKSIVDICRANFEQQRKMESTREPWQGQFNFIRYDDNIPGGDYGVAPVFILVLGDTRTRAGLPMGYRYSHLQWQNELNSSLAGAYLYMHLAAKSLGLGSQWVSSASAPYSQCMIKDLLKIPVEFEIYDMMALGYTAVEPGSRILRDIKEMIHYDSDNPVKFRTEGQIKEFIRDIRSKPH
jgi:5,6-dimethylbenzimidazole synthase